jgi:hypothetical protein
VRVTVEPILRLYPVQWRQRYADEVDALLADRPPGVRNRVDLLGGAIDAHLHPWWVPAWPVVAAATGGIAWTFAGAIALGQPAPPDWPGYLAETLPVFLAAVPLLMLAALGASTRLGNRDPRAVRLGRPVVVLGSVAWTVLLAIATANLGGGAPLAIAATAVAAGTLLLAIGLLGAGDWAPAIALLAASLCLLVPATWAPVAYGAAWTAAAVAQLLDPRPTGGPAAHST